MGEAIDYVKTELMPDFDFDAFNHDTPYEGEDGQNQQSPPTVASETPAHSSMETIVADLTETPIANDDTASEEVAEKIDTPAETNNDSADNGSTEVAEKW